MEKKPIYLETRIDMLIETPNNTIPRSAEETFNFLSKPAKFKALMPESIEKFEVLSDTRFLFALKGMPEIVLEQKETIPFTKIILGAASEKLPFTLTATIAPVTPTSSTVALSFSGEFNAMMGMMIKNPITKFINTLATNMNKI